MKEVVHLDTSATCFARFYRTFAKLSRDPRPKVKLAERPLETSPCMHADWSFVIDEDR